MELSDAEEECTMAVVLNEQRCRKRAERCAARGLGRERADSMAMAMVVVRICKEKMSDSRYCTLQHSKTSH